MNKSRRVKDDSRRRRFASAAEVKGVVDARERIARFVPWRIALKSFRKRGNVKIIEFELI